MGIAIMPIPKISGYVSSSNYLSFDGANENLMLLGGSVRLGRNANLMLGVGNDWTLKEGKNKNEPAIEIKGKYNIGEYLNAQARFREIGGCEQYRLTFGGSYAVDQNNSVYASIHTTAKNNGEWRYNTGGWVGYTYKFNNGVSVSGELQQNIGLNRTSKGVGKTLECFDDSNKMFNVIVSVPIKYM